MRTTGLVLLAALVVAGCSSPAPRATPPGCGLIPRSAVVGLLGKDVETVRRGSVPDLRSGHRKASCRSSVPGRAERYVTVVAEYHPKPFRLPRTSCSEGWVYAGTPAKYAPACQRTVDGHGRTDLFVRWQPYLVHVTIGRTNSDWAGDPEAALAMSRSLARRLGVREAANDG